MSQDRGRSPGARSNSLPVEDRKLPERELVGCRTENSVSRATTDQAIAANMDYKGVPDSWNLPEL